MKKMLRAAVPFAIAAALAIPLVAQAQSPVLMTFKELKWIDQPAPKGARQVLLWGDEQSTEHAVMVSWPINTKLTNVTRTQDLHVLVIAGTVTIDVEGKYREFGPSGVVVVPKGLKHTLGCEAAGECRFLVHHPGPVQ